MGAAPTRTEFHRRLARQGLKADHSPYELTLLKSRTQWREVAVVTLLLLFLSVMATSAFGEVTKLSGARDAGRKGSTSPNEVRLAAKSRVVRRIPHPGGLLTVDGAIWVQSRSHASLWKLSPNGEVLAKLHGVSRIVLAPTRGSPANYRGLPTLAAGLGSIWSLTMDRLVRINPDSARIVDRIEIPPNRFDTLTVAFGAVWLVGQGTGAMLRVDPRAGDFQYERHTGGVSATGPIAADASAVWMASASEGGSMILFNPVTERGRTALQNGHFVGNFMLHAFGGMYVADGRSLSILTTRRQPTPGVHERPRSHRVANRPIMSFTAGLGALWVNAGRLISVNPRTGKVRHSVPGVAPWTKSTHPPTAGIGVLWHKVWMVDPVNERLIGLWAPKNG
jgi:hypothetical protein